MSISTKQLSATFLTLAAFVLPTACRGPDKAAVQQDAITLLRSLELPIKDLLSGIQEYTGSADSMTDQQRHAAFSAILVKWNDIEKCLGINSSAIGMSRLKQVHIDLSLLVEAGGELGRH